MIHDCKSDLVLSCRVGSFAWPRLLAAFGNSQKQGPGSSFSACAHRFVWFYGDELNRLARSIDLSELSCVMGLRPHNSEKTPSSFSKLRHCLGVRGLGVLGV